MYKEIKESEINDGINKWIIYNEDCVDVQWAENEEEECAKGEWKFVVIETDGKIPFDDKERQSKEWYLRGDGKQYGYVTEIHNNKLVLAYILVRGLSCGDTEEIQDMNCDEYKYIENTLKIGGIIQ